MTDSIRKEAITTLSSLALALMLTGCGGGASDNDTPSTAATPDMVASFNSVADYCGIQETMPVASPSSGYIEKPKYYKNRDGRMEEVSAMFSTGGGGGAEFSSDFRVDFSDYRDITTGAYVDKGSSNPNIGMGMHLVPNMQAGSIACIKSVAWLKTMTSAPQSTSPTYTVPERTLVWESYVQPSLPIASLGAYPVDGFELVSNFTPRQGLAYFSVKKSSLPDASAVHICQLPGKATTWNCLTPKVTEQEDRWFFSIEASQPGTYLLTSSHATRNQ